MQIPSAFNIAVALSGYSTLPASKQLDYYNLTIPVSNEIQMGFRPDGCGEPTRGSAIEYPRTLRRHLQLSDPNSPPSVLRPSPMQHLISIQKASPRSPLRCLKETSRNGYTFSAHR
ncbi:hypothetical protein GCM10020255_014290 [Rhodococcus baikonurensis]